MHRPKLVARAEQKLDNLTAPGHGQKFAAHEGPLRDDELPEQQRLETEEAWAGPGLAVMTDAQWKGGVLGAIVGAVLGAALFLPLALVHIGGLAIGWRLLLVAGIGAIGGATAGAVYGGGRLPELEGEVMDADGRPSDGTTMRDPHTDARGR